MQSNRDAIIEVNRIETSEEDFLAPYRNFIVEFVRSANLHKNVGKMCTVNLALMMAGSLKRDFKKYEMDSIGVFVEVCTLATYLTIATLLTHHSARLDSLTSSDNLAAMQLQNQRALNAVHGLFSRSNRYLTPTPYVPLTGERTPWQTVDEQLHLSENKFKLLMLALFIAVDQLTIYYFDLDHGEPGLSDMPRIFIYSMYRLLIQVTFLTFAAKLDDALLAPEFLQREAAWRHGFISNIETLQNTWERLRNLSIRSRPVEIEEETLLESAGRRMMP